ncbi:multidrug ABC transporter permease [Corynebacterium gerontici]|uniref:ABC-2 family transporter protein n=1 Tax=Corynebacterium gerontici TaxID=2079234 RepID=A0A3G6IXY3_9CORY|nr:multidrug ABC transporter permease [Corynebacterium gerontici]AZA10631.1 ABC-2 family transporter protein [Corynebacterium gerontici]
MLLKAEWTKLRSTKAFWWTSGLFFFFSFGFALLIRRTLDQSAELSALLMGMQSFGTLVLAVQSIMVITSEYRYNSQNVTFLAVPSRLRVAAVKWLIYALIVVLLVTIAVLFIAPFGEGSVWKAWCVNVCGALALMTLSQGVAYITRQAAGAIAIVFLWQFALEPALAFIPKAGAVYRYAPFNNYGAFLLQRPVADVPWGWQGSGLYFAAWALVMMAIGVTLLLKRDA